MPEHVRMVAVLLLVAMTTGLPGAHALVFFAAPLGHPAGCHGPATPAPAPTNFQCCVSGHHEAIPNASFSLRSVPAQLCSLAADEQPRSGYAPDRPSVMFVLPSNSPPGTAPLRL